VKANEFVFVEPSGKEIIWTPVQSNQLVEVKRVEDLEKAVRIQETKCRTIEEQLKANNPSVDRKRVDDLEKAVNGLNGHFQNAFTITKDLTSVKDIVVYVYRLNERLGAVETRLNRINPKEFKEFKDK
jgi:hypothetical protein